MANHFKVKDEDVTEWVRCVMFGKDAETIHKYNQFEKGDIVSCMGTLRTSKPREGADKDEDRKVAFIGSILAVQKKRERTAEPAKAQEAADEDLPF